ncbi:MAG: DUF4352 domain-containing protein [Candidatus Magasanikbacteria bacterium]
MKKYKSAFLVSSIFLSFLLIGASCDSSESTQQPQNSDDQTKSNQELSGLKVGETKSSNYIDVTLTDVKRTDSYKLKGELEGTETFSAKKGKDFVLINFEIKNVSDKTVEVSDLGWEINAHPSKSGDDKFEIMSDIGEYYTGELQFYGGKVKPGKSIGGWNIAQVPDDHKNIRIIFNGYSTLGADLNDDGKIKHPDERPSSENAGGKPLKVKKAVWTPRGLETMDEFDFTKLQE